RAYGPASPAMERIEGLLEAEFAADAGRPPRFRKDLTAAMAARIYPGILPAIEGAYAEALARADTPARRARVRAFGDAMRLLHWHFRTAGLVARPEASIFYQPDDVVRRLARGARQP